MKLNYEIHHGSSLFGRVDRGKLEASSICSPRKSVFSFAGLGLRDDRAKIITNYNHQVVVTARRFASDRCHKRHTNSLNSLLGAGFCVVSYSIFFWGMVLETSKNKERTGDQTVRYLNCSRTFDHLGIYESRPSARSCCSVTRQFVFTVSPESALWVKPVL